MEDGFERVFSDKSLYHAFDEYLKQVFDADNLHFYKDVFDFKKKEFKRQEELEENAKEIARTYGLNSEDNLVLSFDNAQKCAEVRQNLHDNRITQTLFDSVLDEVADALMARYVTWSAEKQFSKKKKKPLWFADKEKGKSAKAKVGKMIRMLSKKKNKDDDDEKNS